MSHAAAVDQPDRLISFDGDTNAYDNIMREPYIYLSELTGACTDSICTAPTFEKFSATSSRTYLEYYCLLFAVVARQISLQSSATRLECIYFYSIFFFLEAARALM